MKVSQVRKNTMPSLENYRKIEKINGIVYSMSPSADYRHGIVNGNIFSSLKYQLRNSLCKVYIENLDLYISEDEWLVPDIMIICNTKDIRKNIYKGIPKLIVETLSPTTARRDRKEKMEKYAEVGVSEYWIVSAIEKAIEIYYLNENGHFELKESFILEGDPKEDSYNADTEIVLRELPNVSLTLADIFDDVDWVENAKQKEEDI